MRTTFLVAALLLGVNATEARAQLVALGVGGDFGFFSRLVTASAMASWGIGDGEGSWSVGAGVSFR